MRTVLGVAKATRCLLSALTPSSGLPHWEDLPAYDQLSNELADRHHN